MISTSLKLTLGHCDLKLGDPLFVPEITQDTIVGIGTTFITYDVHNFSDRMSVDTPTSRNDKHGFSFTNANDRLFNAFDLFPDISQTGIGTTMAGNTVQPVGTVGRDTVRTVLENVTKAMLLALLDGTSKRTTTISTGSTETKKQIFFNTLGIGTGKDYSIKPWGGSDAFNSTHTTLSGISSISRTNNVAKITTSAAHGLNTSFNDWGAIVNINTSSFNISTTTYPNGVPIVITGDNTFTYRNTGINTSISSGITGITSITVGWGGTSNNLHLAIF